MTIPVYVPDWQIGDGDIERPYVGMVFRHVLLLETDTGDPALHYGSFGRETTVSGVATHLAAHTWHREGTFATAVTCDGFVLYWEAPVLTEGPVTLTGIIDATDYGSAPQGFPEAAGVLKSMELASLQYVNEEGDGMNWVPAPGRQQRFRPISLYPRPVPEPDNSVSPQEQVIGVVLHLDTSAAGDLAGQPAADGSVRAAGGLSVDGRVSGSDGPIRIRIFPDYAGTVLWLHGPVDYADAALSPGLAADMAAWEAAYHDSLDGNEAWKSRTGAARFTATGQELAQRLAVELGEGFEVEFHSYAPGSTRQLFHSDKHSRNPAAAGAFHGIVAAEEELQARFEADQADGVGWFAYAPLSGTVFDPGNNLPPGFDPHAGPAPGP